MIIRKPCALAATANCINSFALQSSTSSTSQCPGTRQRQCRSTYATVTGDNSKGGSNERHGESAEQQPPHVWPAAAKGQTCPTPYQIFAMKQNGAYSKARFYELVKLYHPDRGHCNSGEDSETSHAIKIERYRLIVAAHAILSDPVKRNAYDRFGAGWNGKTEFDMPRSGTGSPGPFSHSWSDPNDPIWRNATWEDWERWHARKSGVYPEKSAPVYMANSYFLALVVALAMIGGSMNYGRAQDAGHYFVEQRDLVHDRAAKELRRVRKDVKGLSSKDDRIDFFVRQREATMGLSGFDEQLREERASRLLPDKEICQSEDVKERDT